MITEFSFCLKFSYTVLLQKEQNISISVTQSHQNLLVFVRRFAILKRILNVFRYRFTMGESQRIPSTHNACCLLLNWVVICSGTWGQ